MKNNNNVFGVKMLQFFAQLQSNSLSTTFQLFVRAYKNTIYSLNTNHIVSLTRDPGKRKLKVEEVDLAGMIRFLHAD